MSNPMPRGTKRGRSRAKKKPKKMPLEEKTVSIREATGINIFGSRVRCPLPLKIKANLIYSEVLGINPGSGVVGSHVFRASDLYDPDFSGVGHQPRGFDELIALYDHFVVIGSQISVISQQSPTDTQSILTGITLRDAGTTSGDPLTYLESSYTSYDVCRAQAGPVVKLNQRYNPSFLGRSKPLSDPNLKGSASGSPVENAFYHIWAYDTSDVDPGIVRFVVRIEYIAMFIEPKLPSES